MALESIQAGSCLPLCDLMTLNSLISKGEGSYPMMRLDCPPRDEHRALINYENVSVTAYYPIGKAHIP